MSFCLLAFDYNIILATRCLGVSVSFLGVPAIAVGLSAISFSAALQKDAAPIPNALELLTPNS